MIDENLRTLRRRFRYSQETVAEKIGVSRQAVAKWENGETLPDLINASELAKLYNVSLDDLMHYSPQDGMGLDIAPKGKYAFGMVTVGEKGQIVIPARARKIFHIQPGDQLVLLGDIEQGLAIVKSEWIVHLIEESRKENEREAGNR